MNKLKELYLKNKNNLMSFVLIIAILCDIINLQIKVFLL